MQYLLLNTRAEQPEYLKRGWANNKYNAYTQDTDDAVIFDRKDGGYCSGSHDVTVPKAFVDAGYPYTLYKDWDEDRVKEELELLCDRV